MTVDPSDPVFWSLGTGAELTATLGDDVSDGNGSDLDRSARLEAAKRTDQTQIARFWADETVTQTPPGHWNRIAAQAGGTEGLPFRGLVAHIGDEDSL